MKGIRLTKAEVAELESLDQAISFGDFGKCTGKAWDTFMAKVRAASAPAQTGVAVGPIETALVAASRGKVVPLVGHGGYARATKQATAVGATVEHAKLIGAWMARTGWLTGPKTILDVLNQWSNWLTKASATAPPPSAPSGFGEGAAEKDAKPGQGTAQQGQGAPGRLRPGFGG
jgi:hypothetical protein